MAAVPARHKSKKGCTAEQSGLLSANVLGHVCYLGLQDLGDAGNGCVCSARPAVCDAATWKLPKTH